MVMSSSTFQFFHQVLFSVNINIVLSVGGRIPFKSRISFQILFLIVLNVLIDDSVSERYLAVFTNIPDGAP